MLGTCTGTAAACRLPSIRIDRVSTWIVSSGCGGRVVERSSEEWRTEHVSVPGCPNTAVACTSTSHMLRLSYSSCACCCPRALARLMTPPDCSAHLGCGRTGTSRGLVAPLARAAPRPLGGAGALASTPPSDDTIVTPGTSVSDVLSGGCAPVIGVTELARPRLSASSSASHVFAAAVAPPLPPRGAPRLRARRRRADPRGPDGVRAGTPARTERGSEEVLPRRQRGRERRATTREGRTHSLTHSLTPAHGRSARART